jgi:membrane protein DedA with SNARE-associated domain
MWDKESLIRKVSWILISLFLLFCIDKVEVSASDSIKSTVSSESVELILLQDSLQYNQEKDSLNEIVPYLDDIEGGPEAELLYILLIVLTTLMSEDLACIGAGLMVAKGFIEFWPAALASIGGIFLGDFTLYAAGRLLGDSIFKVKPFSWLISEENVERSMTWFETKGPVIFVMSRFIPGSRFPVYLSAGLLNTKFWKFSLYFGLTVLIWTPIFVWLSVFAGNEILTYYEKYEDYAIWILLAALILLFVIYKYLLPLLTSRGRRIMWMKINRLLNRF